MGRRKKEITVKKEILEKEIALLREKCNDVEFFDEQIKKVLLANKHLLHYSIRLEVKDSDVISEYKGETFYIAKTKSGALFHTYGGYSVYVTPRAYSALHEVLVGFIDDMGESGLTDEEKEAKELDFTAKMHIMLAPTWCFGSVDATYKIATSVVESLNEMIETTFELPLAEEDEAANHVFEDAVMSIDKLDSIISPYVEPSETTNTESNVQV